MESPEDIHFHDIFPYPGLDDFVLYLGSDGSESEKKAFKQLDDYAKKKGKESPADQGQTNGPSSHNMVVKMADESLWRGLACRCQGGQYWSMSLRGRRQESDSLPPNHKDPHKQQGNENAAKSVDQPAPGEEAGFKASDKHWSTQTPEEGWLSVRELAGPLYDLILPEHFEAHGLILLTGSTGSCKSNLALAILHEYVVKEIKDRGRGKAWPHLITLEKPLQSHFLCRKEGNARVCLSPQEIQPYGLDFTTRLIGTDVANLKQGLEDALRQRPVAVLLDEVRDPLEWEDVLRFAGSGHLIVTTAHAGSLVEAMTMLLASAKTPDEWGNVAERILGLVHVRRADMSPYPPGQGGDQSDTDARVPVLVPAVWRNTPNGLNALVADGLSSIIPYFPVVETLAKDVLESSVGRRWFVRSIEHTLQKCKNDDDRRRIEDAWRRLEREAIKWDLEDK